MSSTHDMKTLRVYQSHEKCHQVSDLTDVYLCLSFAFQHHHHH